MTEFNPENERVKRRYFIFQREAKRSGEATVNGVAKSLSRYEAFTKWRSFAPFHPDQAIKFKQHLAGQISRKTGDNLSLATIQSTLQALENFFKWLSGQHGYKTRVAWSDAEYFRMPRKELTAAKGSSDRPVPSLEQIHHTIACMPYSTDIERRDRAVVAAAIVTGARDGALSSARLKHVDLVERTFLNDGQTMRTKFSKTFRSAFFPVKGNAEAIFVDWVKELREVHLFGNDDPLFPKTRVVIGGKGVFEVQGLTREMWTDANAIRSTFKSAFEAAGLPYFNPHSFRHTLARLGQQICKTMEEHKSWSENLGHEKLDTTLTSYGKLDPYRQIEVMKGISAEPAVHTAVNVDALAAALLRKLAGHNPATDDGSPSI